MYFFFPQIAFILAFPTFLPLTINLFFSLPFFLIEIFFFPATIFHLTFFFAFFNFTVFFFPIITVMFFLLNFTFCDFACTILFAGNKHITKVIVKSTAITLLTTGFLLFIKISSLKNSFFICGLPTFIYNKLFIFLFKSPIFHF